MYPNFPSLAYKIGHKLQLQQTLGPVYLQMQCPETTGAETTDRWTSQRCRLLKKWERSWRLQQRQSFLPLLLQGGVEESQRFLGEDSRGEEVAVRNEEVREEASASVELQSPDEVQEAGRELLASPHGVVKPDRWKKTSEK